MTWVRSLHTYSKGWAEEEAGVVVCVAENFIDRAPHAPPMPDGKRTGLGNL